MAFDKRLIAAAGLVLAAGPAITAEPVNIDNFIRAESDFSMKSYPCKSHGVF
jgi:hypothetical protein